MFITFTNLFTTRYQHELWPSKEEEIDDYSKGKMPKRSPKMLQLRRLLRQQLLEALLAPVRRSRHHGRRGGAPADDVHHADNLAARRGPPVPLV